MLFKSDPQRRRENFRTDGKFSDGRTENFRTDGRTEKFSDGRTDEKKKRKKQSVSQTIDLAETIRNLAESSKSELS